jgi:hypothetical protein
MQHSRSTSSTVPLPTSSRRIKVCGAEMPVCVGLGERGTEYEERGTEYEERGTEYEERGTEYEERGTEYEERGTEYEEIGPFVWQE